MRGVRAMASYGGVRWRRVLSSMVAIRFPVHGPYGRVSIFTGPYRGQSGVVRLPLDIGAQLVVRTPMDSAADHRVAKIVLGSLKMCKLATHHVVSLNKPIRSTTSQSARDRLENLQLIFGNCNAIKGNRAWSTWWRGCRGIR